MTTWFTSDLHFSHTRLLELCPNTRGYETIEEMNADIIKKWNEQVLPDDVVYILGDVFFCKADTAIEILEQLNGVKHLILGNHDKVIRDNVVIQGYFDSINEYKVIKLSGKKVVLFHFPIQQWDCMHYGSYHLYGHLHGGGGGVTGRAMDVGLDARDDIGLWSWEEIDTLLEVKEIRKHH